jgi:hypothetical protein
MEAMFWELVGMVDNVLAVGWDFCTLSHLKQFFQINPHNFLNIF